MIKIRRGDERGKSRTSWLYSLHTFSFADYHDESNMHFGPLRVINEDWVDAASGFGTHPHRDMEIITYILAGELEHKDSMGNGSVIRPGEIQRMSAGTGVAHSEWNHSKDDKVHLLQIWILPERRGIEPSYEQKPVQWQQNGWTDLASRHPENGAVTVHQNVQLQAARINAGTELSRKLEPDRIAWLQVAKGSIELNGEPLAQGDGAAIEKEPELKLVARENSEVLLFDMAHV